MTCNEIKLEWFTDEDLMRVQENLSPTDFQTFLKQMSAFHQLQIADDFLDVPETDLSTEDVKYAREWNELFNSQTI